MSRATIARNLPNGLKRGQIVFVVVAYTGTLIVATELTPTETYLVRMMDVDLEEIENERQPV